MDLTGIAKLVCVLVLVATFVATVAITPRIWHSRDSNPSGGEGDLALLGSAPVLPD